MSFWSDLRHRLSALRSGSTADTETAEELRFHLEEQARHLQAQGHTPEEATRLSRIRLGPVTGTLEEVREARGVQLIHDIGQDIRFAWRQLRRSPAFTGVAVATLALGIGANSAIFSVLDGILLQPAPFADPDRLVVVWETDRNAGTTREPSAWPDILDVRRETRSLAGTAAVLGVEGTVIPAGGTPERAAVMSATADYFTLTGLRTVVGRGFTAEEDVPGGPAVAVLGERYWRSRYASDPAVLGQTLQLNGRPHEIIGVVQAGADFGLDQVHSRAAYHGPYTGEGEAELWVPLGASVEQYPRSTHPFFLLARLTPGTAIAQAQSELTELGQRLETTYPENTGRGFHVESLNDVVFGTVRPILLLVQGAVILLLVVACVNIASLLLARGSSRAREVAVRTALGAGRTRLGRQFVVETLLLSLTGALTGLVVAQATLGGLIALAPADLPRIADVRLDLRMLGMTFGVAIVVGLIFGLIPTLQARRVDVMSRIRGAALADAPAGRRLRRLLVTLQLAFAAGLVVSAGLLVRSFGAILGQDLGFTAEGVLKAEYQLPTSRYPRDFSRWPAWSEVHDFTDRVLAAARALPGVEAAAVASAHPLNRGFTNSFRVVGREAAIQSWPEISVRAVTPEYFETMGVRLLEGRTLGVGDTEDAPRVAVVNEAALHFFEAGRVLGSELRFWGHNRPVVGIVSNERIHGLTEPTPPIVYVAMRQGPQNQGTLLVRTSGDPALLAEGVRRAIWAADPELAIFGVEPLVATVSGSVRLQRFAMVVVGAFAVVTLMLALVGIYGMLSYTLAERGREFSIRSALGAPRGLLTRMILMQGVGLATVGVVLGGALALAGSKLLSGFLYGVGRLDLATWVLGPLVILLGTGMATLVPALRAGRAEPLEAMRSGD